MAYRFAGLGLSFVTQLFTSSSKKSLSSHFCAHSLTAWLFSILGSTSLHTNVLLSPMCYIDFEYMFQYIYIYIFHPSFSVHNTRRATQKLDLPFRKSCIGQKTLFYIGPKTWNNLPAQIKLSKNVNTLKHDIKRSFFDDL